MEGLKALFIALSFSFSFSFLGLGGWGEQGLDEEATQWKALKLDLRVSHRGSARSYETKSQRLKQQYKYYPQISSYHILPSILCIFAYLLLPS